MRRTWLFGGLLGLVLLLSYLWTGVTQVRPGERAVVRRLGRVLPDKPGPGLWFGLPWGIDRVDRVPIEQVRRVEIGYDPDALTEREATPVGQLLTGDHNLVNVRIVLNYTVRPEDSEIEDYVTQADQADSLIARVAEAVLTEWIASRTVDDILITAKALLPRWLVNQVQERLAPYHLGVQIQDASVALTQPPDEVKSFFDEVTQAQTQIRTEINKAEENALVGLRVAQAEKADLERLARSDARTKRLAARAEAKAFEARLRQYQELRQTNPDFLAGVWHEEMGKLFESLKKNGRIDLLDHHLAGDELNLMQMPLTPRKK